MAVATKFKADNPTYWREWQRRTNAVRMPHLRAYGITPKEFAALLEAQRGGCAICGASAGWRANGGRLVVDHNHRTDKVRGLLCPSCNRGLGQFVDDPRILRAAATYLEKP